MTKSYDWKLEDLKAVKKNGYTVFSMFCGGGGSSMGYKLAGFDCLGGVEIDKRQADLYQLNLAPKYLYTQDIREFNKREDLPKELYALDILDGSPPCTLFSLSNSKRDKQRNMEKKFREGQAKQRIDTLFFDFIETAKKLRPRIVIAENVKGMTMGIARNYLLNVLKELNAIGYTTQTFLLNSATMGVPQRRERVFIIAHDGGAEKLKMDFCERPITYGEIECGGASHSASKETKTFRMWKKCRAGDNFSSVTADGGMYGYSKLDPHTVVPTITTQAEEKPYHYKDFRCISIEEIRRAQTFPMDYNFGKEKPAYVMGMSVPPFMTRGVATKVLEQWLIPQEAQHHAA